jgi:RNA-binding protein
VIGKEGLTPAVAARIDELLQQHELVKIRMPAGAAPERKAMGQEAATACSAACAGVVGRTALLYRPNPDLPEDTRIRFG